MTLSTTETAKTEAAVELTRNPLQLFRLGYDTLEIANLLGLPESHVYNSINRLRTAERQRIRDRDYHREYYKNVDRRAYKAEWDQ